LLFQPSTARRSQRFQWGRITSNGGVMILAAAALSAHPPALAGNQDHAAR
jgi:hypothetical protein